MRTADFAQHGDATKIEDVETTTAHSSIEVSWQPDDDAGAGEFKAALKTVSTRVIASKRRGSMGHKASRKYLDKLKDAKA